MNLIGARRIPEYCRGVVGRGYKSWVVGVGVGVGKVVGVGND